jgi:hypothetical protein
MLSVVKPKPPKKRGALTPKPLNEMPIVQKLTANLAEQRKQRAQFMDRQSLGTTIKQLLAVTEKSNDK